MEKFWFIFSKTDLLIIPTDTDKYTVPTSENCPIKTQPWNNIMTITPMADGTEVRTVRIDDPQKLEFVSHEPNGWIWEGLRKSFYSLPLDIYKKAGKCQELLYWDSTTQFCGCCGSPMKMHTDISKKCTNCGKEIWPSPAPAVITLIHKGDEVLLVRGRNFRTDFYGLVAGFVETGETLEEAAKREALEETGIKIKNLRYFGSQPWPYPCGIMVGFNADYESGEIHLQEEEIAKGAWFKADNLPTIPEKLSIARMLLDDWLNSLKN